MLPGYTSLLKKLSNFLDLSSKNAQCNFQVVGSIIFSKAVMALTAQIEISIITCCRQVKKR